MPRRYTFSDSSDDEIGESPSNKYSNDRLEQGLRDTVKRVFRSGNLEELTVKRVRLATEATLGLEQGFFKGHEEWKSRSETVIKEEVAAQDNKQEADDTPKPTAASADKSKKLTKSKAPREDQTGTIKGRKRRKISKPIDLNEEAPPVEDEEKHPIEGDANELAASNGSDNNNKQSVTQKSGDESESELSVLLDEPAPTKQPTQRKRSSDSASKKAKGKSTAKPAADADPDLAEIKRLQGWLLKCGIRKFWAKELAPYGTPKAKINHLKGMLEEIGMKGRYSLEKARQIRDVRELQADLEAVKEGAKKWGTGSADDESDAEKPRRRLVKGRQSLAFLSDDGEETD